MGKLYLPARRIMYTIARIGNILRGNPKATISILCYHSISDNGWAFAVTKKNFEKQISYLIQEGYQFITVNDLKEHYQGKKTITKPSIIITFDDGYKDILSIVPFLQKHHIRPTMFLLSDTMRANRKELANMNTFLTLKDIATLHKAGWEFGSHTATHADMYTLSSKQIDQEILSSKHTLEKQLRKKIIYIAYPKGRYTESILTAVKKAGYTFGFSMDDGVITPHTNPYIIPRIGVDGTHTFNEFTALFLPMAVYIRGLLKKL